MSSREIVPFVIAFIGGIGGLVNTLVWSDILTMVNRSRPVDDQIPIAVTSRSDVQSAMKNFPFRRRKILDQFHREFPQSRLNYWYWASVGWMGFCVSAVAVTLFAR
jgi:hypothetical protein